MTSVMIVVKVAMALGILLTLALATFYAIVDIGEVNAKVVSAAALRISATVLAGIFLLAILAFITWQGW